LVRHGGSSGSACYNVPMKSKLESTNQMKIAVYCGGSSSEREISLKSGQSVLNALVAKGLDATLIDEAKVKPLELAKQGYDLVFIALHGDRGENGQIQSELDAHSIMYTGSTPLGCQQAMDKSISRDLFAKANVLHPRGVTYLNSEDALKYPDELGIFPAFVKPSSAGSSLGVSYVGSRADLKLAINKAFEEDSSIIIEEAIVGREIAIGIVGESVLAPIEIKPAGLFYDYDSKYINSATEYECAEDLQRSPLTNYLKACAWNAHQALGLVALSRIDFILDEKGQAYCLEANAIPGLSDKSLLPKEADFLEMSFEDLCLEIIQVSLLRYSQAAKIGLND
jgi:D-alanine-D-alanine ligase